MSTETTEVNAASSRPEAGETRLEVVVIPVADVARAKAFYCGLGWRLDADVATPDGGRLVQLTPTGSLCSIQFGTDLTSTASGSSQSPYLVVPDIDAARDTLVSGGADVSEVFHENALGDRFQRDTDARADRAGSPDLRVLRHVQRSGRQHLAAAGDHDTAAETLSPRPAAR
jgi:catechol 2,3-dioxygenase-like lactoylglutathione lyase family enzyme